MKIRITGRGIYSGPNAKELPIGHEMNVDAIPDGWAGRCIVLDAQNTDGKTAVTNDENDERPRRGRPAKSDTE